MEPYYIQGKSALWSLIVRREYCRWCFHRWSWLCVRNMNKKIVVASNHQAINLVDIVQPEPYAVLNLYALIALERSVEHILNSKFQIRKLQFTRWFQHSKLLRRTFLDWNHPFFVRLYCMFSVIKNRIYPFHQSLHVFMELWCTSVSSHARSPI